MYCTRYCFFVQELQKMGEITTWNASPVTTGHVNYLGSYILLHLLAMSIPIISKGKTSGISLFSIYPFPTSLQSVCEQDTIDWWKSDKEKCLRCKCKNYRQGPGSIKVKTLIDFSWPVFYTMASPVTFLFSLHPSPSLRQTRQFDRGLRTYSNTSLRLFVSGKWFLCT